MKRLLLITTVLLLTLLLFPHSSEEESREDQKWCLQSTYDSKEEFDLAGSTASERFIKIEGKKYKVFTLCHAEDTTTKPEA